MVEVPQDTSMGDYAFPCFKLAKQLRKAPPLIAKGIAESLSGNELFEKVWQDKFTQDGTLNVHIRKIREQIEVEPDNPKYIVTVWKEGYKFIGK